MRTARDKALPSLMEWRVEDIVHALAGTSALESHAGRFQRPSGAGLMLRAEPFHRWISERRATGTWPYSHLLNGLGPPSAAVDKAGPGPSGLNFASEDALGLSNHPAIRDAALEALQRFGLHSGASPVSLGNTSESLALERELADFLRVEHVVLYPSGSAAGFAAITALVRDGDHVVLDERAGPGLQQGARAATRNVSLVSHLDVDALREAVSSIRRADVRHGILVVTEGLFQVDADRPDLRAVQQVCREWNATLLVDVSHDLGATGPMGLGTLGRSCVVGEVDLVVGSFSNAFAGSGGFVATRSAASRDYITYFGGPPVSSHAPSPVEVATVRAALRIVRSPEGEVARAANAEVAAALRNVSASRGLQVLGDVSPIVPVVVGSNRVARVVSAVLAMEGVFANLVEYPAVPLHSARFCFHVMASHTPAQAVAAASSLARAVVESQACLQRLGYQTRPARVPRT